MQQQQLTVDHVQQERTRLETAVVNLDRKHMAANNLATVLSAENATLAEVKEAFASYYTAETAALQHDVMAIREQIEQLRHLEGQLRIASSGLVVGRWNGEKR